MTRRNVPMTDALRMLPAPLFSTADVVKLVPDDNMFLFRASRRGYIKKIANRVYWNLLMQPAPPSVEEVACFTRQPSYVSCEWALHYHGVILQVPTVCTVVTLHAGIGRRNRILYGGRAIEYSRIAEGLYMPEEILPLGSALIATPEKALLDTVYLRHHVPFADELEMGVLDRGRVTALASRFPPIVARRLESTVSSR